MYLLLEGILDLLVGQVIPQHDNDVVPNFHILSSEAIKREYSHVLNPVGNMAHTSFCLRIVIPRRDSKCKIKV